MSAFLSSLYDGKGRRMHVMLSQPFHSTPLNSAPIKIPELGLELSVRLPGQTLSGAMTVMETVNTPGFGPPLHRHPEAEVFRVMEGAYLYEVNGSRFQAEAGDVVCVPGGAAHAFLNLSDKPSRQLIMMLPAMDAERFFLELAAVLASPHCDRAALNAFGAPWSVEFLGPPLTP
jgi:quercetin dioxygenase-like cupin family protein